MESKKPGKKALDVMKLNTESNLFKIPKAPIKKKQNILEEDTYLQEMGKIIQRDFFPDLEKLKAQNEYLDAQSQNDSEKMMQIYEKYSSGRRPPTERAPSPATFETPVQHKQQIDALENENLNKNTGDKFKNNEVKSSRSENEDEDNNESSQTRMKKKLTLDQYLASHTSEDNESFNEIQKESIARHKMKYAWLYQDENEINKSLEDKLKVPAIEDQVGHNQRPFEIDTWTYKNHNPCMYVPEGVELNAEEKSELIRKRHEIVHENTRLGVNPFNDLQNKTVIHELAMNQAKNQEGKIGVDGKIVTCAETPRVNGFSFVRTPSPSPGVNESPLITWGEIEGTPFRLDGSDTPYVASSGPTFRIPEIPKREKLAIALADKASESYRNKKRKAIEAARSQLSSQSPNRPSSINRLNEMSPAAQRLASTSIGHRLGTDRALRNFYSPSPKSVGFRSPYQSLTPRTPNTAKTPKTPIASPSVKVKQQLVRRTTPVSVTDDLLKLPRIGTNRPRASDFF